MADVATRLNNLSSQRAQRSVDPATLKQAEDAAISDGEASMRGGLSPTAMAKVDAYVRTDVKRHIRMYSGPMQ